MLSTFLSLPVTTPDTKDKDAYQYAWRPAGAKPLVFAGVGSPIDEPLLIHWVD